MDDDTLVQAILYGDRHGDAAAARQFNCEAGDIAQARSRATPPSTTRRGKRRRTEKQLVEVANRAGNMVAIGKGDDTIRAVLQINKTMLDRIRRGIDKRLDSDLAQRLRDRNTGVVPAASAPQPTPPPPLTETDEIRILQATVAEQNQRMVRMRKIIADLYIKSVSEPYGATNEQ